MTETLSHYLDPLGCQFWPAFYIEPANNSNLGAGPEA